MQHWPFGFPTFTDYERITDVRDTPERTHRRELRRARRRRG